MPVPGWPGAGRGFQRHTGEGALARVGAASSGPETDGTADSQPRRQQGHPASKGMVPAPGLPQPLRPPRYVPLPSAGEQFVKLFYCGHMACIAFNTCTLLLHAHVVADIMQRCFNSFHLATKCNYLL